jgi:hypothetical protein
MDYKSFHFLRNLAILLGVTFFIFFINPIFQYQKASDWPMVEGVITNSQLKDGGSLFLGIGRIYHADITFDYHVDGKKISGNRIQYGIAGKSFIFKRFAQRTVERYPVGKTTSIHYNPKNPEDEIVELAPVLGFSFLWLVLSALFFGLSIIITIKKKSLQSDDSNQQNRSLRPAHWKEDNVFKDFYPTLIYNPPKGSGEQPIDTNSADSPPPGIDSQGSTARPAPIAREFDGDYPSQAYSPPGPGGRDSRQRKTLTIQIPIIGWQLTISLEKQQIQ